jgi:hypothetical protein
LRESLLLTRLSYGCLFGPLGSVLRSPLPSIGDAAGIQRSPDHMISHSGEILHPSTSDKHYRVLLEVMPFPRDISGDLYPVGQSYTGYLTQSGVRLLGCTGINSSAYSPFLGTSSQRGGGRFCFYQLPSLTYQLIYSRQEHLSLSFALHRLLFRPSGYNKYLHPLPPATQDQNRDAEIRFVLYFFFLKCQAFSSTILVCFSRL